MRRAEKSDPPVRQPYPPGTILRGIFQDGRPTGILYRVVRDEGRSVVWTNQCGEWEKTVRSSASLPTPAHWMEPLDDEP